MGNYFVYIVTNPSRAVLYIGMTNDLNRRLVEHFENRGKAKTFAGKYFCYKLVYFERHHSAMAAIEREKEIKKWSRKKKNALIATENPEFEFLNLEVLGFNYKDFSLSLEMTNTVKHTQITKISDSGVESKPDLLAIEEPLEIRVGFGSASNRQQKGISVTMRTPGHDFELATGFLFTEGIIHSFDQIESIKYCEDVGKQEEKENVVRIELKPDVQLDFEKLQRHFYTSSSCGVCGKTSIDSVKVNCTSIQGDLKVAPKIIHTLPDTLRKAQAVFEYTGGLHACALFDTKGSLIILREDVGRHNALDKVIGAMLFKKETPLSNYILLVSGRASFELVQKAAVAGISILAAVGAPSSLAVQLAKETSLTLLGFVRDKRFNIYCHEQRITNNQ